MRERDRFSPVLLAATLLIPAAASAADAFLARWRQLRAQEPDGPKLVVSAPKTTFFLGETIPLALMFTSARPKSFFAEAREHDRVGRLNGIEQFIVGPAGFTEDPLRGLPAEDGGLGGISGPPVMLSDKPFAVERILNQWVRFRRPSMNER